jgi:WD40 repeat protein
MILQRGSVWRVLISSLASLCLASFAPSIASSEEGAADVDAAADEEHSVPVMKVRMIHSLRDGCLRFLPDDRTLAVLDRSDDGVRLLDIHKGETYRRFITDGPYAECFAFTSDGDRLLTCGWTSIRQWETATGGRLPGVDGEHVDHLVLSPDDRLIATCHASTISLWNVAADGGEITLAKSFEAEWVSKDEPPKTHNHVVKMLAFSSDGRFLLAAVTSGFVLAWELSTWDAPRVFDVAIHRTIRPDNPVRIERAAREIRLLLAPAPGVFISLDKDTRPFQFHGLELEHSLFATSRLETGSEPIAVSPDARFAVFTDGGGCVGLWGLASGERHGRYQVCDPSELKQWEDAMENSRRRGSARRRDRPDLFMEGARFKVRAIAFSPSGEYIAIGTGDSVVTVYRVGPRLRALTDEGREPSLLDDFMKAQSNPVTSE